MPSKIWNLFIIGILILHSSSCFRSHERNSPIEPYDDGHPINNDNRSTGRDSGFMEDNNHSTNDSDPSENEESESWESEIEEPSLIGTWQGSEIGIYSGLGVMSVTFVFTDKTLAISMQGDMELKGSYYIDDEVYPHQMNIDIETIGYMETEDTYPFSSVPFLAIYKIEDDVLTIAASVTGLARPTSLITREDVFELKFELFRLP